LGKALMGRKPQLHSETWGTGSSAPAEIRRSEISLESAVSAYIQQMPFLWVAAVGESRSNNLRSYLEKNSIALLSNLKKERAIDKPSENWLGHLCPNDLVRESGLWNRNYTDSSYDPDFLNEFESLLRE
jgi:hypothetical protein